MPAAAPLARSEDAPPTSSNPFAALKKGFESAVQTATNNPDYQFGDATKWVGGKAAGAINEVTGKDSYEFGDLSRWLDRSAKDKVAELSSKEKYEQRPASFQRPPTPSAPDDFFASSATSSPKYTMSHVRHTTHAHTTHARAGLATSPSSSSAGPRN